LDHFLIGCGIALVAVAACGVTRDAVCSDVSLRAVEVAHTEAALAVITAGKCDAYQRVESCPAFLEVERRFDPAYTTWKLCR
jgi:methylase of polypeptide subunit release factors